MSTFTNLLERIRDRKISRHFESLPIHNGDTAEPIGTVSDFEHIVGDVQQIEVGDFIMVLETVDAVIACEVIHIAEIDPQVPSLTVVLRDEIGTYVEILDSSSTQYIFRPTS